MAHANQQQRDAAKTALLGLPTTGAHVFVARVTPYADSELPALSITTPQDIAEGGAMGGIEDRQVDLVVTITVKGVDEYQNQGDTAAVEVISRLLTDAGVAATVRRLQLVRKATALSDETDAPVAVTALTFRGFYRVQAAAPDVILP